MLSIARKRVSPKPSVPPPPTPVPLWPWMEDDHLWIDEAGDIWLVWFPSKYDDFPARLVGDAHGGCDWPTDLGREPKWFLTEAAYLADRWLDGRDVPR